jgi:RNA polymerase sigma-70 factor (ECF subfamily)
MNGENRMPILNLRDFYPWYTHDEFADVPDDIAAEFFADKRYQKAQERQMYRYKAQYSLDVDNGIEAVAIVLSSNNPAVLLDRMETYCRLCQALNSLPELQGRRVEAHYLLDMSIKEIAETDGTGERNVRKSIRRGLGAMKIFLKNPGHQGTEKAKNCQC